MSPDTQAVALAALAVVGTIVLIAKLRVHAFVALICASLFVGMTSNMPLPDIARAFQQGMGNTLGFIAVVVGLGTILGKLLAESGGAELVARRLIGAFGERHLPWAMLVVGFVIGIPVFFGVGVVLLAPLLFTLVRETNRPILSLAIPMIAGLSAAHGLVPPHPGPMLAIEQLEADVGKTLLYSILVGFPAAVLAGPIFAKFATARVHPVTEAWLSSKATAKNPPGFGTTLFVIGLPVLLMLGGTAATIFLPKGDAVRGWAEFAGNPMISLLVAVLVALYVFGIARGYRGKDIARFCEECLGPVAGILLVVGAGGGFSKILELSGTGAAIARLAGEFNLSLLVLAWVIASLIRVAVGSATVSIAMTAAILAPMVKLAPGVNRELLVLAMGAGSLILSHLNDGGFWFVKEYLQLSVAETLATWTVLETIISVTAFALILLLNAVL